MGTKSTTARFVEEMTKAGLDVVPYAGRWFWKGPAVMVDSLQDAMSETKVKLQSDNFGLGYVVYPVESDEDWYERNR